MAVECGFHPVVAVVGPSAVGKSLLALQVASELPVSVVSADSRMVYRYMDIGTDKPTPEERASVSHFMLDLVSPDEMYSAQRYSTEAARVLKRVAEQQRVPLVVGGTGFYIRALLDRPAFPPVAPDDALRRQLREEAELAGAQALHDRLAQCDPAAAARVHPKNVARVIRALEIVEATGKPVGELHSSAPIPTLYLGLRMERLALHDRVDQRIDDQIAAGLVEETRLLLDMGYDSTAPGLNGFGYREMVQHLEGKITLDRAITSYRTATRQYIRRQMTWFRADPRIHWLDSGAEATGLALKLIEEWTATAAR